MAWIIILRNEAFPATQYPPRKHRTYEKNIFSLSRLNWSRSETTRRVSSVRRMKREENSSLMRLKIIKVLWLVWVTSKHMVASKKSFQIHFLTFQQRARRRWDVRLSYLHHSPHFVRKFIVKWAKDERMNVNEALTRYRNLIDTQNWQCRTF